MAAFLCLFVRLFGWLVGQFFLFSFDSFFSSLVRLFICLFLCFCLGIFVAYFCHVL